MGLELQYCKMDKLPSLRKVSCFGAVLAMSLGDELGYVKPACTYIFTCYYFKETRKRTSI